MSTIAASVGSTNSMMDGDDDEIDNAGEVMMNSSVICNTANEQDFSHNALYLIY